MERCMCKSSDYPLEAYCSGRYIRLEGTFRYIRCLSHLRLLHQVPCSKKHKRSQAYSSKTVHWGEDGAHMLRTWIHKSWGARDEVYPDEMEERFFAPQAMLCAMPYFMLAQFCPALSCVQRLTSVLLDYGYSLLDSMNVGSHVSAHAFLQVGTFALLLSFIALYLRLIFLCSLY